MIYFPFIEKAKLTSFVFRNGKKSSVDSRKGGRGGTRNVPDNRPDWLGLIEVGCYMRPIVGWRCGGATDGTSAGLLLVTDVIQNHAGAGGDGAMSVPACA